MGASYGCDTGVGRSKLPSRRLRRFLWKLPGERCVCSRVPLAGHLGWPAVQNKHPALTPTRSALLNSSQKVTMQLQPDSKVLGMRVV